MKELHFGVNIQSRKRAGIDRKQKFEQTTNVLEHNNSKKTKFAMLQISLPCSLLAVLLSAPHASSFLDPSPKGSLDGVESDGGAGEPQASSALTGAVAAQGHTVRSMIDIDRAFSLGII